MGRRVVALAATFVLLATPHAGGAEPDKTPNVRLLKSFRFTQPADSYTGATDIDFQGRFAYVAGGAGVHIYDLTNPIPRELSFFRCRGSQNDVAVVRPGLIALGYHRSRCGSGSGGVTLINVRDPRRPFVVGVVKVEPGGTHTLTTYPGKPYIYSSPGGTGYVTDRAESIIDVSNPRRPRIVATFDAGLTGCHDVSFSFTGTKKLAFCAAGYSYETEIWDVSDPIAPEVVGRIVNPANSFHHSAVATRDGKYLAIGDENYLCSPTQGSVWFYDISDVDDPRLMSRADMEATRGAGYCTAHNFNFARGTYKLVNSWYTAGMNVIDFTDPSAPKEIAHYTTPEVEYWSAYYYDGRVFASDMNRGLDVFRVRGL